MPQEPKESPKAEGDEAQPTGTEAAQAFVTGFVDRFAQETATWIKDSARTFNSCFEKALSPAGYTANELVRDAAAMWAVNLEYLGRLVRLGAPGDDTSADAPPSSTGQA
jgi:hypothetical protein